MRSFKFVSDVALETLLIAVGQKFKKPRVRCFMSLKNKGGNMPDGGLVTQDQIHQRRRRFVA